MRRSRSHRHLGVLAALLLLPTAASCSDRVPNNVVQMHLAQSGSEQNLDLSVTACREGDIQASDGSWAIQLDEKNGGEFVEVILTTPEGARLAGVMLDGDAVGPFFSGSGSVVVSPEDDPNAAGTELELSWLCD
jgi:hypothetical protein